VITLAPPAARPDGYGAIAATTHCRGLFVAGTDTGVGKTRVACALLRALSAAGLRAVGMKPVAAGIATGMAVNADVAALARAGNVDAPLADRNPFAFDAAVAPHLAAAASGARIGVGEIGRAYGRLCAGADAVVVEGAGGVLCPIDERQDMLDVVKTLDLPVLLVVGMRLGCLNHALLSAMALQARAVELRGWVANCLPPAMPLADANILALTGRLGSPPIATSMITLTSSGGFLPIAMASMFMTAPVSLRADKHAAVRHQSNIRAFAGYASGQFAVALFSSDNG
jgi:dethiobiotin synthetase